MADFLSYAVQILQGFKNGEMDCQVAMARFRSTWKLGQEIQKMLKQGELERMLYAVFCWQGFFSMVKDWLVMCCQGFCQLAGFEDAMQGWTGLWQGCNFDAFFDRKKKMQSKGVFCPMCVHDRKNGGSKSAMDSTRYCQKYGWMDYWMSDFLQVWCCPKCV